MNFSQNAGRFVIRPSDILFASVYVCTFQPGNVTGWGSEGVKAYTTKSTLDPIAARFLSQNPCIGVLATDVTIMARFKFSNALRPQRSWGLLATGSSEHGHLEFHTPPQLIWLECIHCGYFTQHSNLCAKKRPFIVVLIPFIVVLLIMYIYIINSTTMKGRYLAQKLLCCVK